LKNSENLLTEVKLSAYNRLVCLESLVKQERQDKKKYTKIEEVTMYHIDLALDADQVKRLKQMALQQDQTVKEYVTNLVLAAIKEPDPLVGKQKIKNIKEESKH
jgi:hypothetical protein